MRLICLSIPHFYVQAARHADPVLKGKPLIIGGTAEGKGRVVDCSEDLVKKGVTPSMDLKDACRLSDDAVLVPFRAGVYRLLWAHILSSLADVTLRMESVEPGTAFLDVTHLPGGAHENETCLSDTVLRLAGDRFCLSARVGVGSSRFTASEAALKASSGAYIIPPGDEKRFLAPLSVEQVPVSRETKERLRLLGLVALGQVQAFPLSALLSQFGAEGKVLWECACGMEDKGRIPGSFAISEIEEDEVLEAAAHSKGQLEGALADLLDRLCRDLGSAGLACRAVTLALCLQNGSCWEKHFMFHSPESCKENMGRRIMSGLERLELESPVQAVNIRATALSPYSGRQEGLFRMRRDIEERLKEMGGFLKTKYGAMPLVRVRENDVNTLLPDERFVFVES